MKVIEFSGSGKPSDATMVSGSVLILVQGQSANVVKVVLPSEDQPWLELEHATNPGELGDAVRQAISTAFPGGLDSARDWTLTCPDSIAALAVFAE